MHRAARRVGFGLVLFLSGCSSSGGDTGDAGDGGDEGGIVGGCGISKLPTEDTCVVTDSLGVFVSSSMGSAAGDGTKAKPFASLQAGITAAKAAQKRVYACAESYAESLALADGVSMFGYFDCSHGWTVGATHAKVQSTTSPVATAANIVTPTRFEAVDLVAPDFTDKSQSSIGIIVVASPALTITHATIHTGTGGKGADGAPGASLTDDGTAKNGKNSTQTFGACTIGAVNCPLQAVVTARATAFGAGGTNTCGGTGHPGGSGGNGGTGGEFDSNGLNWLPNSTYPTTSGSPTQATAQTNQGSAAESGPFSSAAGQTGADGAAGSDGPSGGAIGTFTQTGYAAADGVAGGDGQPGQGGGGAGGYGPWTSGTAPLASQYAYGWGESGAGGGAGGCPGLAGQPGKGGGASVAVVALQSNFVLDTVTLETGNGGNGGVAGAPGVPTSYAGGAGGAHSSYSTGAGGAGGAGGHAGISGNGAGGPSIGLVFQGTQPSVTACTITHGQGGAGVSQAPASPAGLGKDTYGL